MADDIVTRLRAWGDKLRADWPDPTDPPLTVPDEAADEIERLRAEVRWSSDRASEWKLETYQLNTEIERLRAAGDVLAAAHVDDLCDCAGPECVSIRGAHDAWQKARRG